MKINKNHWIVGLLALIVFAIAGYLRYRRIFDLGVSGHDTFQYFVFSERLITGDPYLLFYRPLAYLINGIGLLMFHYQDHSIKFMVSTFDSLNAVILFLLAVRITGSRAFGFAVGLFYASWLPMVLQSGQELCHIYSTTFLLGFLIFFICYLQSLGMKTYGSDKYLALMSLWLGLAANTHEDMGLLTLFIGCVIGWVVFRAEREWNAKFRKTFLKKSVIAGLSFCAPFILGLLIFGPSAVFKNMAEIHHSVTRQSSASLFTVFTIAQSFFMDIYGFYLSLGFVAFVLLAGYLKARQIETPAQVPILLACAFIPLFYLLSYSFLVGPVDLPRLFTPMLPIGILVTFCGFFLFLQSWHRKLSMIAMASLMGYSIWTTYKVSKQDIEISWHRQIYLQTKDLVGPTNKLGVPFAYENRKAMWGGSLAYALSGHMYLGDQAVTFSNFCQEEFEKCLEKNSIKYVLITDKFNDIRGGDVVAAFQKIYGIDVKVELRKIRRALLQPETDPLQDLDAWSKAIAAIERDWLTKKMTEMKAQKVRTVDGLASIYELP